MDSILSDVEIIIHLVTETGTGQSMYSVDRYMYSNISGTNVLLGAIQNSNSTVKNHISIEPVCLW